MGLLKHVLGGPVTLPLSTFQWLASKIQEQALNVYTDPNRITSALMELESALERDLIDEDEFDRQEALLLAELKEIKAFRAAQAEGVGS